MKPEKLSDAIGMLDDDILEEADRMRSAPKAEKKSRKPLWIGIAATAACAVIIGSVALKLSANDGADIVDTSSSTTTSTADGDIAPPSDDTNNSSSAPDGSNIDDIDPNEGDTDSAEPDTFHVAEAKYPVMVKYPEYSDDIDYKAYNKLYKEWSSSRSKQRDMGKLSVDEIRRFFENSSEVFLSESGGENIVYSPANVYMAMSMLAEITDGNTRQQLLSALTADSMESLRESANNLWNGCYSDDGLTTSELANALWLDSDISYNTDTLDTLASNYYASSYSGEMGSEGYNTALRDWVNERTKNLLTDSVDELEFSSDALLALTSTTYFKAQWGSSYSTKEGTFNAADGSTQQCSYLTYSDSMTYFWGDNFTAINMWMEGSGSMWIILPDEGYTAEQLASDEQVKRLLRYQYMYEENTYAVVHMSVPMFDVSCDMSLIDGMMALGVTDVFDYTVADFSPLMNNAEELLPYVDKADHSTRVMIDEVGCTGASFVEIEMNPGAGPAPDEELYFTADRPFMFAVVNECGIPLYCGIVNTME